MSVDRNRFTELFPDVANVAEAHASIDHFVDRLRTVRARVGGWPQRLDAIHPAEVFRAVVRLDSAVAALDACVAGACLVGERAGDALSTDPAPSVDTLIDAVETRASELESVLADAV